MVAFIGLNPSTADETTNDPTVTRCINFAKDWGFGGMFMLNIFAYRATDPDEMKAVVSPIGKENDDVLIQYDKEAALTIACWGNHGSHMGRGKEVLGMISRLYCLGWNKTLAPKHPLYLPSDTKPRMYVDHTLGDLPEETFAHTWEEHRKHNFINPF